MNLWKQNLVNIGDRYFSTIEAYLGEKAFALRFICDELLYFENVNNNYMRIIKRNNLETMIVWKVTEECCPKMQILNISTPKMLITGKVNSFLQNTAANISALFMFLTWKSLWKKSYFCFEFMTKTKTLESLNSPTKFTFDILRT